MLTTLRIKNLALAEDLTVEFLPGYNVITGETGAGKSILIGALNLVLGERAERTLIRSGSDSCSVEAVFDIRRLKQTVPAFLEENGLEPCEDQQLLLKRTFTAAGANRQFINGSPTTLNVLAALGESLVDIHGPHEHQSLLNPARQLELLDAFAGLVDARENFAALLRQRASLQAQKASLIVDERTYQQQLDLLRFQTSEISAARLQPVEDEQVESEYRRASNAARLLELSQGALELLAGDDNSVFTRTEALGRALKDLHRLDAGSAELPALHEQAFAALRELNTALSHYAEHLDLDPARLRQLEERLNLLQGLKRKYGATLADVIAFGLDAQQKLNTLEQRDAALMQLNEHINALNDQLLQSGRAINRKRSAAIPPLSRAVSQQLTALGFTQSRFNIALKTIDPFSENAGKSPPAITQSGFDTIEFQFEPNPGEPARPLRAIASSGELARVMLALKTVLAAEDRVPVLVFDEVDANVGGETANAVGEKMRKIAQQRQVLCITHLPQVAGPASAHFVATKKVRAGRTISQITLLEGEDRITELARMLGGQSEVARRHAEALLA